jgi:hypothetical protein
MLRQQLVRHVLDVGDGQADTACEQLGAQTSAPPLRR